MPVEISDEDPAHDEKTTSPLFPCQMLTKYAPPRPQPRVILRNIFSISEYILFYLRMHDSIQDRRLKESNMKPMVQPIVQQVVQPVVVQTLFQQALRGT